MKNLILTLSVLFIILISLSSQTATAQINYGSTQSKTSAVTVTKIPYYELDVYPNPTKDYIYFKIKAKQDDVAFISVYNTSGMTMMESKRPVNEGVNYFQLDVTKLSAGVYILIVELNGYGYKAKFQKL